MKILDRKQIREADLYTIQNEPVSSEDLMERAAEQCFNWIQKKFTKKHQFKIFCATGNNGGDGLVIARKLLQNGYSVQVYEISLSQISEDYKVNYDKLRDLDESIFNKLGTDHDLSAIDFSPNDIIIDAIFGSGLSRPIEQGIGEVIELINGSGNHIVSIDIPSGLYCDNYIVNPSKYIVKATDTLTFETVKYSFLFSDNHPYVGEWHVLSIGLHNDFLSNSSTQNHLITPEVLKGFFKKRHKFSHKGTYGHALLVAGSYGKIGAAILASKAALKSGCGLVTVQLPAYGVTALHVGVPEAMVNPDSKQNIISEIPDHSLYKAVGIGPGIGDASETQKAMLNLFDKVNYPVVIDADAINIISGNKDLLKKVPSGSIFTPHKKEFIRLLGITDHLTDFEMNLMQRELAQTLHSYIILKGAHTCVAFPDGSCYFNHTGNPGMATAGSGDVLSGIITSFLAQGYSSAQASLLGVYIHGKAADMALKKESEESLVAGNIIENLSEAFKYLKLY